MKLKAFDKASASIMRANSTQSGCYYVEKMHKSGEVNANIPLENVTGARVKSDRANQTQAKYIQCILPFLCILQVISLVSVTMCFFFYKTTSDEYTSLQNEMRHLQHDYLMELLKHRNDTKTDMMRLRDDTRSDIVKLQNEIEANVTAHIRDLQHVSRNLSQAKSKLYDYDAPDYDTYEDETDNETETAKAPPPPLVEDGEPDNLPPTKRFRDLTNSDNFKRTTLESMLRAEAEDKSEEPVDIKTHSNGTSDEEIEEHTRSLEAIHSGAPNSSYAELQEDEPWLAQEQRVTRSIHYDKEDPYAGVNPDKNDAEGDYRDIELPVRHKPNRPRHPIGHVEETVTVLNTERETPISPKSLPTPQSAPEKSSPLPLMNQPKENDSINSSLLLEHARSLRHMEETLLALRLSWESSQKDQSHQTQPSVPSVAMPSQPIAIHLVGDTSKYKHMKEKHYDANHRMYHPKGHIKDWKVDSRISPQEKTDDSYFKLENGHLRVNKAGLYFVYAQIYYSTKEDTSGFNIFLNDNIIMRCITTGVSSEQLAAVHATAPNSCYTAGLMRIEPGDKLSIKETQGERFTIFESTRSFFGLFKVV